MEKIFSMFKPQSAEAERRQFDEFIRSIKDLPIQEAEQAIANDRFRKPIVVFDLFSVRPFWRDGRSAPSLFPKETPKRQRKNYKKYSIYSSH